MAVTNWEIIVFLINDAARWVQLYVDQLSRERPESNLNHVVVAAVDVVAADVDVIVVAVAIQAAARFQFSFQVGIVEDEDDGISRFKESGLIIRPNFNDSSKTFSTAKLLPAEDFSPKDEKSSGRLRN